MGPDDFVILAVVIIILFAAISVIFLVSYKFLDTGVLDRITKVQTDASREANGIR